MYISTDYAIFPPRRITEKSEVWKNISLFLSLIDIYLSAKRSLSYLSHNISLFLLLFYFLKMDNVFFLGIKNW